MQSHNFVAHTLKPKAHYAMLKPEEERARSKQEKHKYLIIKFISFCSID